MIFIVKLWHHLTSSPKGHLSKECHFPWPGVYWNLWWHLQLCKHRHEFVENQQAARLSSGSSEDGSEDEPKIVISDFGAGEGGLSVFVVVAVVVS